VTAKWIDLVDPTREEILESVGVPLEPDALERITARARGRGTSPVLEAHGDYVFAILSRATVDPTDRRIAYFEVDVVATPKLVVTVRKTDSHGEVAPIDGVAARVDEGGRCGAIFHAVVDDATDSLLEVVDALYEEIDAVENDVERLSGAEVRRRVSELRHELLRARKTSSATRGIARRIVDGRVDVGRSELFPREVEALFMDTYETLVRVTEELDVARDLLAGVRDYYQAKIAEQQNDVAKKLTVIASLVLVPSFIVGFYGQNFAGEFRDWWWSVGVSVGLIVATTAAQLVLFRTRGWI
jgi:magnesium transporter